MITKNIEKLCKEQGITISGLEKKLGLGNSTISKWAKFSPTVANLSKVAEFFGVTVDELLKNEQ